MITAYSAYNHFKPDEIHQSNLGLLKDAVWIDLVSPSKLEAEWVQTNRAIQIPTQEKMREIETSSRLYSEGSTIYMTATMVAHSLSVNPKYDAVTFVLTTDQLITIRYIEPHAFRLFSSNLLKSAKLSYSAMDLFISLLEATVDRLADVLEYVGHHLDEYSNNIFQYEETLKPQEKLNYKRLMQNIGIKSNLNTKARESLVTFSRLVAFFWHSADGRVDKAGNLRLDILNKDLVSLSDYANFISNKINFLLDATLGMVSIEQSSIIKIFSVAAVIFLPPTLIASIYGMNFKYMPELSFKWGYYLAIAFMLISAWLPYKFFKYKRWL